MTTIYADNAATTQMSRAALDANYLGVQDTPPVGEGALDVLAQHVLGMACAEPFAADALHA